MLSFQMRIKRILNSILWSLIFILIINILLLYRKTYSVDDSADQSDSEQQEALWSSRDLNSDQNVVDSLSIHRFQRGHWQNPEVNSQVIKEPLLLKRQNGLLTYRIIEPEFLLPNVSNLKWAVNKINREQIILNEEQYNTTDFIIVIQVHSRIGYLKLLIESLRRAKDVHRALIVFSHDLYYSEINRLVRSIGFAKIVQIFFPYSQQIYPSTFPGADPNDCPRNLNKQIAIQRGCINALHPDTYGHYREPAYTQTKHHWIWKLNFVFENLRSAKTFSGPIVFLEEDHYVIEDFFHMISTLDMFRLKNYPDANLLCLGSYEKKNDFVTKSGHVQVGRWVASKHNMGMTIDRNLWSKIKTCIKMFCQFDDYNWDWSFQFISMKCLSQPLKVVTLNHAPRVFHIGECGVHHKNKVCSPNNLVSQINRIMDNNMQHLYPTRLEYAGGVTLKARIPKANGGWGDLRDRTMCQEMVFGMTKDFPIPSEINATYKSRPRVN